MTANYERAVVEHIIDLFEKNENPAGLIELIPQPSFLLIENIAVLPNQQGKGLGHLLLKHAETVAHSLRLIELQLYTNAVFVSNIEFYARRGFREFSREPFPAGGLTVHMKKLID